jgi:plasmid maintenance system antidote protein VapI
MTSFRITISPTRRAAARFVTHVRRSLQQALVEENRRHGLTQSDIARELDVHRSVINRELRGEKDITLGRVAEIAFALGRKPVFALPQRQQREGVNTPQFKPPVITTTIANATISPPVYGNITTEAA